MVDNQRNNIGGAIFMETREILLKQTKAKAYCYAIKYLESVIHQNGGILSLEREKEDLKDIKMLQDLEKRLDGVDIPSDWEMRRIPF